MADNTIVAARATMKRLYLEKVAPARIFTTGTLTASDDEIIAFAKQFDPQPFHLDPQPAKATCFQGQAAGGWHSTALCMRLLVGADMSPAGGMLGAGIEHLVWMRPAHPDDTLRAGCEILNVRRSTSRCAPRAFQVGRGRNEPERNPFAALCDHPRDAGKIDAREQLT